MHQMELIIRRDYFPFLDRIIKLRKPQESTNMSLGEFLRDYQSEDTLSFNRLLEKDRQDWEEKY